MQTWSRGSAVFQTKCQNGKKCDLTDFDRGMIVGARQGGLSISETADLLGFTHTTVSRVCREMARKEKAAVCMSSTVLVREGKNWPKLNEGDSRRNNHALQQWYAEEHL